MPKIWVRIAYPSNPHPEPYDAYKAVAQVIADEQGFLDEMLFDMREENSYQYLLITTQTKEGVAGVITALGRFNPSNPLTLVTLGEVPSNGGSAA